VAWERGVGRDDNDESSERIRTREKKEELKS